MPYLRHRLRVSVCLLSGHWSDMIFFFFIFLFLWCEVTKSLCLSDAGKVFFWEIPNVVGAIEYICNTEEEFL